MTGWRPATKRPRNGQRVVVWWKYGSIRFFFTGQIREGFVVDGLGANQEWKDWDHVVAWIPESELIKAARAAAKGEN